VPQSDQTKAIVDQAIESFKDSVGYLNNLDTSLTNIGADINVLKKSIDEAIRQVLAAISKLRDGQQQASSVLQGTTGMVSESLLFTQEAENELENMARALYRMKAELEQMQTSTMQTAVRDRGHIIGKLKAAIGHLRGYWSTL